MKPSILQDNIYDIINAILTQTGSEYATVPIIWNNENAPKPAKPYVTLLITTNSKVGEIFTSTPDNAGDTEKYKIQFFNLSIQAIGIEGFDVLDFIKDSFDIQTIEDYYNSKDIAIYEVRNIQDISISIDQSIEQRWLLELTGSYGKVLVDNMSFISSVGIDGTINKPDESTKDVEADVNLP